ncbi:hypothetical protein BH18ACI4_BH18ACI4_05050 [soil metagenome]
MESEEGIAPNILANRLKRLLDQGIITKSEDPGHKQKLIYSLTEKGIQLFPIIAQMAVWGRNHLRIPAEFDVRAKELEEGLPRAWKTMMERLRTIVLREADLLRARAGERAEACHPEANPPSPAPPRTYTGAG